MTRWFRSVLVALTLGLLSPVAMAGILVGSFNALQLGWDNGKNLEKLAHIAHHLDLIAWQEVMTEEAVEALVHELETASGERWGYMVSHAIGRGSYRERYLFTWRESRVEYSGGAVVYIDDRDRFAREPFLAKFRSRLTGQELALANIHVLYGNSIRDRLPEIEALVGIWDWMADIYPGVPRIIAGDFNLAPGHAAWDSLRQQGAVPAITEGATTLSTTRQQFVNLYDNLWKEDGAFVVSDRGIIDFPALLGIDFQRARDVVSDHAPVFIGLGSAKLALTPFQGAVVVDSAPAANDPGYDPCVDLNGSGADHLEQLPHIGPARATAIIEERPWGSVEALTSIPGIGPSRLADIRESGLLCDLRAH
jgi:endonuclease/exonuclease/phosphatase family metal-dependent hydrolase|tara:strand:- start:4827 stop:5921 length:1095 start_codon:yes stop_codon:yes gene_type:complete